MGNLRSATEGDKRRELFLPNDSSSVVVEVEVEVDSDVGDDSDN